MKYILLITLSIFSFFAEAQTNILQTASERASTTNTLVAKKYFKPRNPFTSRMYFAWGYNKEWYSSSTIKVSQPSQNSHYQFNNVSGNDHIGWDKLFQHELTIPQYNYRFGFFTKKHPSWGFEFNFDHTKYQMTPGQYAHVTGTINGRNVDTNMVIIDSVNFWKLNNGANFFCFNVMKRFYLGGTRGGMFKLFTIYKLGIGPVIPHVENTLMGHDNNPHFQLGGFNAGFEAAYRLEITKFFYLDLAQKVDYANYFGLRVYEGTAKQSFFTYEVMATLGIIIPYKEKSESPEPKPKVD